VISAIAGHIVRGEDHVAGRDDEHDHTRTGTRLAMRIVGMTDRR